MQSFRQDGKEIIVQLKRRISDAAGGTPIWETDWQNISDYFIARLSDVTTNLDVTTLQGKIEQSFTSIKVNNFSGKFNPEGTVDSLWDGTTQFMYHSRIRVYEFNTHDYQWDGDEEPTLLPLIDGLIAGEPDYKENMTCNLRINSKLDILREHYLLEKKLGRVKTVSSQAIIKEAILLLDNTYAELGITTTGGVFREEVFYDNITPYSKNLLDLVNQVILDGGGVGGLTRDNNLFFTYIGNTAVTQQPLQEDGDTIGLWHWDDVDEATGPPTYTIYDQTANNYDLTAYSFTTLIDDTGFFKTNNFAGQNWERNFASPLALTDYTIDILFKTQWNGQFPEDHLYRNTAYGDPKDQISGFPLFAWSDWDGVNGQPIQAYIPDRSITTTALTDHYGEGFFVDQYGMLHYKKMKQHATAGGISQEHATISEEYDIELCNILGENVWQLISIGVDDTNNRIKVAVNGKVRVETFIDSTILNSVTKGRFATLSHMSLAVMYKSGMHLFANMRLRDVIDANFDNYAFTTAKGIFGSEYTLGV